MQGTALSRDVIWMWTLLGAAGRLWLIRPVCPPEEETFPKPQCPLVPTPTLRPGSRVAPPAPAWSAPSVALVPRVLSASQKAQLSSHGTM